MPKRREIWIWMADDFPRNSSSCFFGLRAELWVECQDSWAKMLFLHYFIFIYLEIWLVIIILHCLWVPCMIMPEWHTVTNCLKVIITFFASWCFRCRSSQLWVEKIEVLIYVFFWWNWADLKSWCLKVIDKKKNDLSSARMTTLIAFSL